MDQSYAAVLLSGKPTRPVSRQTPAPPPPQPQLQEVDQVYEDENTHYNPPPAEDEVQDDVPTPPTMEEEEPQPDTVALVYGKELVGFENTGCLMINLNVDYEDEFWTMLAITAGPMGLCNLGVSCRYFCGKFFSRPTYWELVASQTPVTVQPSIKFFVDFSPDGGPEDAPVEKVQNIPLSQIKTEPKKQQLGKYWLRTVTKAVAARDSKIEESKKTDEPWDTVIFRKPDINVVLQGGFVIETLHPKQKLVQLRDLKQVLVWLKAIDETLLGKKPLSDMFVNIPYEHGHVSLRRTGRGGTEILVKVVEGKETRTALFTLDSFLLGLYSVSEEYLSILVYCKNSFIAMGQRVPSKLAESWKANEDYILKNSTGMDELIRALNSIKEKLSRGHYIPRSSLPEAFRTLQALHKKRKDDEASTTDNISDFIYDNLPPLWKDTKNTAVQLTLFTKEQRERESLDRAARRELERQQQQQARRAREEAENNRKNEAENINKDKRDKRDKQDKTEKVVKPKTKTVKLTSADGFITVKTVAEGEEIKYEKEVVEEPVAQSVPKKKKKSTYTGEDTLKSNPYAVVLQDKSYETQEIPVQKSEPKAPTKNEPSTQSKKTVPKQTTKTKSTDKQQPTDTKKSSPTPTASSDTSKKTTKPKKEKKEKPEKKEKKDKSTSKKQQKDKPKKKHEVDLEDDSPKFEPIPTTPTPVVSGGKKGKKGTQAQLLQLLNHDLFKPLALGAVVVMIAAIAYTVYLS